MRRSPSGNCETLATKTSGMRKVWHQTRFVKRRTRVAPLRIARGCGFTHIAARMEGAASVNLPELATIAGAFLLAGFVKGMIGVGLPTVSIGLLGLMMTPAQAAAVLVVPSLITNVWQFLAGGCIGTVLGVMLLPHDDAGRATIWLGLALALYAALGLVNVRFTVPRRAETWLGLLVGTANGAIAVATGVFVVPGTPYIQSMDF